MKTATEILKECTGHAHGLTDAMHIQAMHLYAIEKVKEVLPYIASKAKLKGIPMDEGGYLKMVDVDSILSLLPELIENIKNEK